MRRRRCGSKPAVSRRETTVAMRRRGIEAAECHFEAGETDARDAARGDRRRLPARKRPCPALNRLAWVRALREGFHVGAELFEAALAEVGDDLRLQIETERGLAWCLTRSGNVAAAKIARATRSSWRSSSASPGCSRVRSPTWPSTRPLRGRGIALRRSSARWPSRARSGGARSSAVRAGSTGCCSNGLESSTTREPHSRRSAETLSPMATSTRCRTSSFHLARVECLAGNWEQAARYAEECHEAVSQTGQEEERPYALAIGALVDAHLGLVERRARRRTRASSSRSRRSHAGVLRAARRPRLPRALAGKPGGGSPLSRPAAATP